MNVTLVGVRCLRPKSGFFLGIFLSSLAGKSNHILKTGAQPLTARFESVRERSSLSGWHVAWLTDALNIGYALILLSVLAVNRAYARGSDCTARIQNVSVRSGAMPVLLT